MAKWLKMQIGSDSAKSASVSLICLLLLSLFLVSCGGSKDELYRNEEYGFSFTRPQTWDIYSPPGGVVGFIETEENSNANISIVVEQTGKDVNAYLSSSKQGLHLVEGVSVYEEKPLTIAEKDGFELAVVYDLNEQKIRQQNVIFVDEGNAYCLVFSAPADVWHEYEPLFSEMQDSFRLDG